MTNTSTSSGAQASYRGYRLQALYALDRLLALTPETDSILQPEGLEDFDILLDGRVIETVQVKSYPALVFSQFSAGKRHPLISRIRLYLASYPGMQITVANFGTIGPELAGAWSGERASKATISKKFADNGFSEEEIGASFRQVQLIALAEEEVKARVFESLQEHIVGVDPEAAFDLLSFWLYMQAEASAPVSLGLLLERVVSIGRFLAEQRAHHQEWFTSITPLSGTVLEGDALPTLRNEFLAGIAARYDHILAGLDIPRPQHIDAIHARWQTVNVVIVRAASGQGKTTLALRYVHDYYPGRWRFKIELIQDRLHALRVARALSGFAAAVRSPIIIYIDVSPRDVEWPELVQRLAGLPYVRVLVTIREEDFQRAEMAGAAFSYGDVSLTFDQEEAERFFASASAQMPERKFIDFREAWTLFGAGGPLLEFVYVLTQTGTLRARLESQVKRIRDEISRALRHPSELQILQVVAVTTAYEARVEVAALQRITSHPDLATCLSHLEREYLVRRTADGSYLEGLHPVRSSLLSDLLCDPTLSPWIKVAEQGVSVIAESDAESFLLRALLNQTGFELDVLGLARSRKWSSWSGFAASLRAHMWLMLRANSLPSSLPETVGATTRAALVQWLRRSANSLPSVPRTDRDWAGISWTWHCLAALKMQAGLYLRLPGNCMSDAVRTLSLKRLAEISLGMFSVSPKDYEMWWRRFSDVLLSRLAEDYGVLCFRRVESAMFVHYLFDGGGRQGKDSPDHHSATMERVWLVRQFAPNVEKFGARAYGHNMGDALPMEIDDTRKDGIPVRMLPPPFEVQANRVRRNLRNYEKRVDSWGEFISIVVALRKSIVQVLDALSRWGLGLATRLESQALDLESTSVLDDCRECLSRPLMLPKQAVDPLGFGSEDDRQGENEWVLFAGRAVLTQRYRPFFLSYGKVTSDFGIFIHQVQMVAGDRDDGDDKASFRRLSVINLHSAHRSMRAFQSQFRNLLGHLVSSGELDAMEGVEESAFCALWPLWCCLIFGNSVVIGGSQTQAEPETLVATVRNIIAGKIENACKSVSEGFKATVHNSVALGRDVNMWIELDFVDPCQMIEGVKSLVEALHVGLGELLASDCVRCVVEDFVRVVYVVPTFGGKAVERSAWQFGTFGTFFGSMDLDDPKLWWKWIRHALEDSQWESLGLSCWETPELRALSEVHGSVQAMWILVAQVDSLNKVPEFTPAGRHLVDASVQEASERLQEFGKSAIAAMAQVAEFWAALTDEQQSAHPQWGDVVETLPDLLGLLSPDGTSPALEAGPVLAGANLSESYTERLARAANIAAGMKLWWLSEIDIQDCP